MRYPRGVDRSSRGAPRPQLDFGRWIVWSSGGLVAVNKPAGVLSQGGEGGAGVNLVDLARAHFGRGGIGVLHRIDRNVSGLVLLALDPRTARAFTDALGRGEVEREYAAVVRGRPADEAFTVQAPLLKDARTNEVRVATAGATFARAAHTEARVMRTFSAPLGRCALLAAWPITGRSHQLRVHLAHVGLPIVGDPKYGVRAQGIHRPLLHARAMRFADPHTSEAVELVCPPPWRDADLPRLRP